MDLDKIITGDSAVVLQSFPDETRYRNDFEFMFVFSKGAPKILNKIKDRKNLNKGSLNGTERKSGDKLEVMRTHRKRLEYGDRGNIWQIDAGLYLSTKDKCAFEHPAIFPEALARDHILSWSNEGDTVLDCFAGSGTTLKMAKMLSRHYIGIERVPKYVALAEKRILASPVPLFGMQK